ncbi:MAG: hypothetical protein Q9164_007411, partial [Protoblastenia rupestris]
MLHDEQFSGKAKVDRYGRRLPGGRRTELEKFYRMDGQKERKGEEEEGRIEREVRGNDPGVEIAGQEEEEDEEEETSSSSSDEESLDEQEDEEEVFGMLEQQEGGEEGIPTGEVSARLAVVNLDWDNIRAVDLMAVFSSFVPGSGRILRISVYPSEFGRERMEREEMEGPPREIFGGGERRDGEVGNGGLSEEDHGEEDGGEEEVDDEDIKRSILKEDPGNEFNSAKLRRYQLERLRYYYAVITCSSTSTASAIYDAVDGTEYLTTANFFDLRYIPDSTDFAEDKPRDECERIPDGYRPNEFVTDALQHSKVRLTWDADDGSRKEAQKRAFAGSRADLDENDLKAYLGSESSEDEAPEPVIVDASNDTPQDTVDQSKPAPAVTSLSKKEVERQKMRALLGLAAEPIPKKSKAEKAVPVVGDMQITFSTNLTSEKKGSVFENTPEEAQETTVEKYVRKEKERKARRKDKLKASRNGTDAPAAEPSKETEEKSEADDDPGVPNKDLGFSDPFFAITPENPTSTSRLKAEKRAKRKQREAEEAAEAFKRAELELLMTNDENNNNKEQTTHFDIKALARAQKALSKTNNNNSKSKLKAKKRLSERDKQALEMQGKDVFEMDVRDERFRDVFEIAEFAIDPSHARFLGTEGMRKLLEEERRV